jgi:NADPH:quinone reductase-like Zn-dependent oxidoreductase
MRAAGITQFGGAVSDLELPDPPPPGSGEALIEVRAAGVANWDDIVRTGGWDTGAVPPMALGVEAAGMISAVGPDDGGWAPGDAVLTHPLPLRYQGAWSEQLLAPTDLLARKPDSLSWEQAGVLPVPALTADQALDAVLGDAAESWLLVNGAGGVTGRMVAALAVLRGARVIAVAGPASASALAELGVEHVLDRHDTAWQAEVARLTGGAGVTAAVNAAVGGETAALPAVADGGRFATITGSPPPTERDVTVMDIYVRPDGKRLDELTALLRSSGIEVGVGTVLPLSRAAEALELATHGRGGGAVVLTPG